MKMTEPPFDLRGIRGVLFDMDGTLVDSEDRTERAVAELLEQRGIELGDFDLTALHGVTWEHCTRIIRSRWPALETADRDLTAELIGRFHDSFVNDPPPPILGAAGAVRQAAEHAAAAIVTSSNRHTLEVVAAQLGVTDVLAATVAAEDVARSKPDPEPFVLGARRLSVDPSSCLVFEDSRAGVAAALAAGAKVIRIAPPGAVPLPDYDGLAVPHYDALPPDFFARICAA